MRGSMQYYGILPVTIFSPSVGMLRERGEEKENEKKTNRRKDGKEQNKETLNGRVRMRGKIRTERTENEIRSADRGESGERNEN